MNRANFVQKFTELLKVTIMNDKLSLIDMHAHLSSKSEEDLELRKNSKIITCFSAGTPQEWQNIIQFHHCEEVMISFGIHPWYADRFETMECKEYFKQCDFIGEIGMDSFWCDVPIHIQKKSFEQQLQIAADLKKPVILHTKGQESLISDMIKDFTENVCIHWFSGTKHDFNRFLNQNCYFTLGPDTAALCKKDDILRRRMVSEIPVSRLFLETDGIDAIAWARGTDKLDLPEIPKVLNENLEYTARIKNCSAKKISEQMQENLKTFLN